MIVYYLTTAIGALAFGLASFFEGKNLWGEQVRTIERRDRYKSLILIFLSFAAFFVVMAARYEVGTDYNYTYARFFRLAVKNNMKGISWEPLFKIFYLMLSKVTHNSQWVFIITSFVIAGLFWYAIYRLSPIPWLSVVLFVVSRHFFVAMNGVRQYVGLALVCAGLVFLARNKVWEYFLMVIIGTMCHYSIAMFIPLYFLCKINVKPIHGFMGITALSLVLPMFGETVRTLIGESIYSRYIGSKFDVSYRYDPTVLFQILFVYVVVIYVLSKYPIKKDESLLKYLHNLYLLCVLLSLNLDLFPNSIRILWSLELPVIFLIPILFNRIQNKKERIILTAAVLIVYGYFMVTRISLGDHSVLPYRAIIGGRELIFV